MRSLSVPYWSYPDRALRCCMAGSDPPVWFTLTSADLVLVDGYEDGVGPCAVSTTLGRLQVLCPLEPAFAVLPPVRFRADGIRPPFGWAPAPAGTGSGSR